MHNVLQETPFPPRNAEAFLLAWRAAVEVAGFELFGDGTEEGFRDAKSKYDLKPRLDQLVGCAKAFSDGHYAFLAIMVSMFNYEIGQKMAVSAGRPNFLQLYLPLDQRGQRIVLQLLATYEGW